MQKLFVLCCLALVWTQQSHAFVADVSRSRVVGLRSDAAAICSVPQSFVILGASGDLAKRKIYPALWALYRDNLLPPRTRIYGYALSDLTVEDIRVSCAPFIQLKPGDERRHDDFWKLNAYVSGSGDADTDYEEIDRLLALHEAEANGRGDRIFYLALPPSVFPSAASQINRACMAKKGAMRVVIEKPFGHDSESSEKLSEHMSGLFIEDQIYRMDHFLGKEMVQNLLALRFGNRLFSPSWNSENIAAVEILFEENIGVEGRGGYFDSYGIIRDVMQNHLLQILSLIAMEKPQSGHPDDVRDAKVDLLNDIKSIVLDDVILGQYIGNPNSVNSKERVGYLEDPTVPAGSLTPTFALTVLRINNKRWRGVPFIIRAGKALKEKKTEVRIQYRDVPDDIHSGQTKRNELVFRVGKEEAIQMKIMSKTPGITSDIEPIQLDFTYKNEYKNLNIPEAYERLILDVFRGSQMNFVRTDELSEAWRIFTPILHEIESKKIRPLNYKFGSRGPVEADAMEKQNDFW